MLQALGDAQHLGDFLQERGIGLAQAGDVNRDLDVRARAERRQKIEFLEHESDLALAQPRALAVGKRGEIHAVDGNASRIGAGQSAKQIKERGLAAARRADDGDELALLHAEGNTAQGRHIHFANPVGFAQFSRFNEGRHPVKTISQERAISVAPRAIAADSQSSVITGGTEASHGEIRESLVISLCSNVSSMPPS